MGGWSKRSRAASMYAASSVLEKSASPARRVLKPQERVLFFSQRFKSFPSYVDDVPKDCLLPLEKSASISWVWPLKAMCLLQERPVWGSFLSRESQSGASESSELLFLLLLLTSLTAVSLGKDTRKGQGTGVANAPLWTFLANFNLKIVMVFYFANAALNNMFPSIELATTLQIYCL